MLIDTQPALTEADPRAMMQALGKAEGEFIASLVAPLFWVIREADGHYRARNGSAFFLDIGGGVFGVTANHVLEGWREDCATKNVLAIQLSDLPLDLDGRHRLIDAHEGIDIATFRISAEEVRQIGKTVLSGYQRDWPPPPPQRDKRICYAGFPGVATLWVSPKAISFGIVTASDVASSVSDADISTLIERDGLIPVLGKGIPPENYDFRGMSGGPMLVAIAHNSLRTWALAGVIYAGPNTSPDASEAIAGLEIIRARRTHFLRIDGTLDTALWAGR